MRKLDAIIFDIDGTLWDSTIEVARAWNDSTERHLHQPGVFDEKTIMSLFGKPMDEIWQIAFPDLNQEVRTEFCAVCSQEEVDWLALHPGKIYEGVYETIEELSKQIPLYIVSNCQLGYIEVTLKGTKMESFFRGHMCFGDTLLSKDQTILQLMERYQLKDVVYVGDTQGDADACKAAGIPFIFAKYGFGEVPEATEVIENIRELPEVLARGFLEIETGKINQKSKI